MTALAAPSGISTAYALLTPQNRPSVEEGNGPPDHAKAWGWRAKQPAPAEATPPAAETQPATAPAVDALLSGSFGDIKLKLEFESEAGEFKIEVSRDEDGLSVEIKAETDHGEIKISFESGEHDGPESGIRIRRTGRFHAFGAKPQRKRSGHHAGAARRGGRRHGNRIGTGKHQRRRYGGRAPWSGQRHGHCPLRKWGNVGI